MNPGYFLAIAGNIGVGKTELTRRLSEELGWLAYYEPVIHNPYLDPFYADMRRWSFHLQIYFLSERFKAQVEIGRSPLPFIQDRTIYEDAEIFARNLYGQKLIDRRDFETYWELYQSIRHALRPPDLMIQLRCGVRTLRERIRRRGRGFEQQVPTAYLQRLNRLYEDWFERWDLSPVLVLDTARLDWMTDLVDRADLFERIERHL